MFIKEKKIYFKPLSSVKPSGAVLQIGFGSVTEEIQTSHPKSHTIIVSEIEAAKEAKKWAQNHRNVTIIQDKWEKALPLLGIFDTILFSSPLPEKVALKEADQSEGQMAVKKGKELLAKVKETIPELLSIRYSDQDIEEFYQQVGRFQLKDLSRFLSELKQNGQISEKQYESFIEKYKLEKVEAKTASPTLEKTPDPLFPFLQRCLEKHMRKESLFFSFSTDTTSRYEDPDFFAHIITNPLLEYQEELISGPLPLLAIRVEKLS